MAARKVAGQVRRAQRRRGAAARPAALEALSGDARVRGAEAPAPEPGAGAGRGPGVLAAVVAGGALVLVLARHGRLGEQCN
jgi:hypothetical protein